MSALYYIVLVALLVGATHPKLPNLDLFRHHRHTLEMPREMKVAYVADMWRHQESNGPARSVLNLLGDEAPDIIVHAGDIGYHNDPDEWCDLLNDRVPHSSAYMAVPGESEYEIGYFLGAQHSYESCLTSRGTWFEDHCQGLFGVLQFCTYNGILILLTAWSLASPSVREPFGLEPDIYTAFVKNVFERFGNEYLWKVCVFHKAKDKYVVQGSNDPNADYEMYDICRQHGAMIVSGDSHTYSRTYLMSCFKDGTIKSYNRGDDLVNPIELHNGQSIAVVTGLGGASNPASEWQRIQAPHWAKYGASNNNATFGALICTYYHQDLQRLARCEWKHALPVDPQNSFSDYFYMSTNTTTEDEYLAHQDPCQPSRPYTIQTLYNDQFAPSPTPPSPPSS